MDIKSTFFESEYPDAPYLSDQLLLPNLAAGFDINLVSSFAPSYLFRLLRDVAESPEIEPGFLNLTFFVPGGVTSKAEGIARFRHYLLKYAESEGAVAQFIEDIRAVVDEGQLAISLLFGAQRRPLTKGCLGVISYRPAGGEATNAYTSDFVTFVDAKGGDFNSPVHPKKSWVDEDYLDSVAIFNDVKFLSTGQRGVLIGGVEVMSWMEYLASWYDLNPPSFAPLDSSDTLSHLELPTDDPVFKYLKELGEFQRDDQYAYEISIAEADTFDWGSWYDRGGYTVESTADEAIFGHIPPVKGIGAVILGNAKSVCVCGKVFTRVYGCSRVEWP